MGSINVVPDVIHLDIAHMLNAATRFTRPGFYCRAIYTPEPLHNGNYSVTMFT